MKNRESLFRHWGFGGPVGHIDYYPTLGNDSRKSEIPGRNSNTEA